MELHKYDLEILPIVWKWSEVVIITIKRSQLVDKYKDIKELIKQIYNHHKGRLHRITLAIKQREF
jgi:hypothetical protein